MTDASFSSRCMYFKSRSQRDPLSPAAMPTPRCRCERPSQLEILRRVQEYGQITQCNNLVYAKGPISNTAPRPTAGTPPAQRPRSPARPRRLPRSGRVRAPHVVHAVLRLWPPRPPAVGRTRIRPRAAGRTAARPRRQPNAPRARPPPPQGARRPRACTAGSGAHPALPRRVSWRLGGEGRGHLRRRRAARPTRRPARRATRPRA
jgi:hypothetical protein